MSVTKTEMMWVIFDSDDNKYFSEDGSPDGFPMLTPNLSQATLYGNFWKARHSLQEYTGQMNPDNPKLVKVKVVMQIERV